MRGKSLFSLDAEGARYQLQRRRHWDRTHSKDHGHGRYYRAYLRAIYRDLVGSNRKVLEIGCGDGTLLANTEPSTGVGIDFSEAAVEKARKLFPRLTFHLATVEDVASVIEPSSTFDYIIASDLLNDIWDVQSVLQELLPFCDQSTRLIFNFQSHLWTGPLRLAEVLRLKRPTLPQNWLTVSDLKGFLQLAGFELVSEWEELLVPINLGPIGGFMNRYLAKLWPTRYLALTHFAIARLTPKGNGPSKDMPSVSVVIPARNEAGSISKILERLPDMGEGMEVIFVEGGSSDGTYDTIQKAIENEPQRNIQLLQQDGTGKGDAVRKGFAHATGNILVILDADMTVPPEDLPRFVSALNSGVGEFINGVRLVYPMSDRAMRFANLLGNKFFSSSFSWLLGQPIRDTLCGTKVLWRSDYLRIAEQRARFGDFDPFGDFDLLFGAANLNLRIVEVPIRYRAREYGDTNIQRWKHGLILMRMTVFAAFNLKFPRRRLEET